MSVTFTFYDHQGTAAEVSLVVEEEYDAVSDTYRLKDAWGLSYGFPAKSMFYYTRKEEDDVTPQSPEESSAEGQAQGHDVHTGGPFTHGLPLHDGEGWLPPPGSGSEAQGVPGE